MPDCRVCHAPMRAAGKSGGVALGQCTSCGSVQRLLTAAEYTALDPTYDPGRAMDNASTEEIVFALDIAKKKAIIACLLTLALGVRNRMRRQSGAPPPGDKDYGASARQIASAFNPVRMIGSALSLTIWPINRWLLRGSTLVATYRKVAAA